MPDNPVELLERELLGAARRMSVASSAPVAAPQPGRRRRRRRPALGTLALAASVIVVFLVAGVALVALHGHSATRAGIGVRPAHPDSQLRAALGVLRRPQTAADRRALKRLHELGLPLGNAVGGRLDPASARLATVTRWHVPVLVAVVGPAARRRSGHPPPLSQSGLLLSTAQDGGCCATAAGVEKTGDASYENDGGPPAVTRVYVVVPDGVARVTFHVAAGKGEPTRAIGAAVHGNVAAIQTHDLCCAGWSPLMTWYALDGHVIKTIVTASVSGSVTPPRSATPEQVTVSPRVGSPQTTFNASFRAPRTGAAYYYKLAGPSGCAGSLTGSFATARRLDIRGRRIAIPLFPLSGQSRCPGTWTVRVGEATDRSKTIVPGAPTFGSATFTVRR
jgi:hypothetical protein